ncbi:MAG: hypothetical protein KAS15_07780 [Nanoarchaeota archaeon]|nr:hypothetical protein [Nanoarchaeota archaeon]
MGKIIESKFLTNDKVKLKICLNKEEVFALKGHIHNINIIAEDALIGSKVIERGQQGSSKYFTIPRNGLKGCKIPAKKINCNCITIGDKILFIYDYSKHIQDL